MTSQRAQVTGKETDSEVAAQADYWRVCGGQTCSQVSEVQVQVKSQVFEVKSKSSLKSLKRSPSQGLKSLR